MKFRSISLFAAALVAAISVPTALAGPVYEYDVVISGRYVRGSIATAHNSADTIQYIGCDVIAYASGTKLGSCYARDVAGTAVGCTTSVPAHLDALAALDSDSVIVLTWDTAGRCDYMSVRNVSWFEEKQ